MRRAAERPAARQRRSDGDKSALFCSIGRVGSYERVADPSLFRSAPDPLTRLPTTNTRWTAYAVAEAPSRLT